MKSEICIVLRSQILLYKLVRKKSDLKEIEKAVNLSKSSAYGRQHIYWHKINKDFHIPILMYSRQL